MISTDKNSWEPNSCALCFCGNVQGLVCLKHCCSRQMDQNDSCDQYIAFPHGTACLAPLARHETFTSIRGVHIRGATSAVLPMNHEKEFQWVISCMSQEQMGFCSSSCFHHAISCAKSCKYRGWTACLQYPTISILEAQVHTWNRHTMAHSVVCHMAHPVCRGTHHWRCKTQARSTVSSTLRMMAWVPNWSIKLPSTSSWDMLGPNKLLATISGAAASPIPVKALAASLLTCMKSALHIIQP